MDELLLARNKARKIWASDEAKDLLLKIIVAICANEPWDELLARRPGYFYDVENLAGAPIGAVDFSNLNFEKIIFAYTMCKGINFKNSNLEGANFTFAELNDANFSGVSAPMVSFAASDLSNANFKNSNLSGANLGGCNLTNADFRGSDLSNVILFGSKLSGANFDGVNMSTAKCGTYVNDQLQLHGWSDYLTD